MVRSLSSFAGSFLFMFACLILSAAVAAEPLVVVTVPDTVLTADYPDQKIPIYLDNFEDSIGAFQLTFSSSRPDLVRFAGFDTSGTLISGFADVASFDMVGDSSIIQIFCRAVTTSGSNPIKGFGPQQGGVAVYLELIVADEVQVPGDNRSDIRIVLPGGFSTPGGVSIGAAPITVYDTTYWHCLEWDGSECLGYVEVNPDSSVVDSVAVTSRIVPGFDSTLVWLTDGSVTLTPPPCAMCDLDCTGSIDIGDLTIFISCLFIDPDGCDSFIYCDWEDDNSIDIADLTAMIRYLFIGGDPPQ